MSVSKTYVKSKNIFKVTFRVPKEASLNATSIMLVGDFNNWDEKSHPMKQTKNGDFSITVELPSGKEFQYRFLYDDKHWENDWEAEYYVATEFPGTENSAIKTLIEE